MAKKTSFDLLIKTSNINVDSYGQIGISDGRLAITHGYEPTTIVFHEEVSGSWERVAEQSWPNSLGELALDGTHVVFMDTREDQVVTSSLDRATNTWSTLQSFEPPSSTCYSFKLRLRAGFLAVYGMPSSSQDDELEYIWLYEFTQEGWVLLHELRDYGKLAINSRREVLICRHESDRKQHIYIRSPEDTWKESLTVDIPPLHSGWNQPGFGSIAFGDDVIVLGSPGDESDTLYFGGPFTGRIVQYSGSVFIAQRGEDGIWGPFNVLKADRPLVSGGFGCYLHLTPDGLLLVGAQLKSTQRAYLFACDRSGCWHQRAQLPRLESGGSRFLYQVGDCTVVLKPERSGPPLLHHYDPKILTPEVPKPKRSRKAQARLSYLLPEPPLPDGRTLTMADVLAAEGDLVAVQCGVELRILRFVSPEKAITEHTVTHEKARPMAIIIDAGRVAVIWGNYGNTIHAIEVLTSQPDGSWFSTEVFATVNDKLEARPIQRAISFRGDWLVYGRWRANAAGDMESYLCGWQCSADGWLKRFEVGWPRNILSIDLDQERNRIAIGAWKNTDICTWTESGPVEPEPLPTGGRTVLDGDRDIIAGGEDGVHVYRKHGEKWKSRQFLKIKDRSSQDDIFVVGDLLYAATSQPNGHGSTPGEIHVFKRSSGGEWKLKLKFKDYCHASTTNGSAGVMAIAGERVLVGFPDRFDRIGGIQVANLVGM